jgi:type I restriction enzyme R subunit
MIICSLEKWLIDGKFRRKLYKEADFNEIIEIKAREAKQVQIYMDDANQEKKSNIFCNPRPRCSRFINQTKKSTNTILCVLPLTMVNRR